MEQKDQSQQEKRRVFSQDGILVRIRFEKEGETLASLLVRYFQEIRSM